MLSTRSELDRRQSAPMADKGMIVSVVSWLLLVVMIFTLTTRLALKFARSGKSRIFGLDDVFIVLAALFSIGQTAAVSMESMHALGQHVTQVNPSQMHIFQKAEYAGCLLYIANMGCARISVCLLVKKLLPGNFASRTALTFAIFSALWTISGMLVTAFPCDFPHPWDFFGKKCINLVKFLNYVWITNIVVEVFLIMIPLFVWNLRLSAGRSVSVSFVFLARLSVIGAVAAQLTFFNKNSRSVDFTYDYWHTTLCAQIAQNLSVITACLPCLHPFILSVLSGAIKADSLRVDCERGPSRRIRHYLRGPDDKFDPTSSQSSTRPMTEDADYCRPLATYGLDRSSAHLNSQHFNRFPSNASNPVQNPSPPENVFMRPVDYPRSRPSTSHSQKALPAIPKTLSEVGVLPIIDFDTDSSDSGRSSPSRRPNSTYIFNRAKVISVPEANAWNEQEYYKKYPPPPLSGEK